MSNIFSMPSIMSLPWLMSLAISSVTLAAPLLTSLKVIPFCIRLLAQGFGIFYDAVGGMQKGPKRDF